jgi:molybdenum transport protein
MAWKVSLNVLEYSMGISTSARKLMNEARRGSHTIAVATTRKSMPGAKAISLNAALAGGMIPHRLGLSETFLLFKQHRSFVDDMDQLPELINEIRLKSPENKIIVEVDSLEEAIPYARAGVDGIQFDKLDPAYLSDAVRHIKLIDGSITTIGAGGINASNAYEYACTGIDVIATSSVFHAKPFDIKASICRRADA